jgi:stage VI sporulation protein D
VTDQNGLRFDIYERIHLPDDVAAIEELEEIEMVPHMQALPMEDSVMLRGHLLLTGVYRSPEPSNTVNQLEHWIPVEISLPLNRVARVEDLSLAIDNFDVDLLSTRTLNVTGVIALQGLQAEEAQAPAWREDEFTVVHQAQEEAPGGAAETGERPFAGEAAEEAAVFSPQPERARQPFQDDADRSREAEKAEEAGEAREAREGKIAAQPDAAEDVREPLSPLRQDREPSFAPHEPEEPKLSEAPEDADHAPHERAGELPPEAPAEFAGFAPAEPQPAAAGAAPSPEGAADGPPESKPAMKVAMGSKSSADYGVGLLSQLGEKASQKRERGAAEADEASEPAPRPDDLPEGRDTTGDELEWTRLFIASGKEKQPFRKVKMCIVQREETLDMIASRYNVQPRELQLYNRLSDAYVSEGQVLYIP